MNELVETSAAIEAAAPRQSDGTGRLYLVGTPIGNLEDMTFRALRILKEVDFIACEDTRRAQKLLTHYQVRKDLVSYHEHNEMTRAPELIIQLEQGSQIALVSDAGMPLISDPGHRLVKLAIRHNIPVVPIPGSSAFIAALAASGLPVHQFRFLGFLPPKKLARKKALEAMKDATKTLVFYEAPHRITDMLVDVQKVFHDPEVVVAREVTKVYEEFIRGSASEVVEQLKRKTPKGEFTVLVAPPLAKEEDQAIEQSLLKEVGRIMKEEDVDEKAALKAVAKRRKLSRSEAYRQLQVEKRKK